VVRNDRQSDTDQESRSSCHQRMLPRTNSPGEN
jgi:hypothetical protein